MSILTIIDGIPLFSTSRQAGHYANKNNLSQIVTRVHNGRTGYMAVEFQVEPSTLPIAALTTQQLVDTGYESPYEGQDTDTESDEAASDAEGGGEYGD